MLELDSEKLRTFGFVQKEKSEVTYQFSITADSVFAILHQVYAACCEV